jgi:alkylglycerol monooxygenase
MEAYANLLMIAMLAILTLVIVEALYAYFIKNFKFRTMDMISSLSAGMTNSLKNVLGLTVVIFGYKHLFIQFAIAPLDIQWHTYIIAIVALDFATYWHHRLAHKVNIFWNRHVIHHSGEDFNIATGLRQSVSKFVNIAVFFLFPAALLGVPPEVIIIVTPLHLFIQIWYHTTHIGKLGWLEYIIVTPSQHRVHHAINKIYMDKNMSPVFCAWDRLFGTFQEELDEEPCIYGVTRQVNTWNPILINLDHLWLLIKDAWRAKSWLDKLRVWFMPTGWRPADVEEKYPVASADPRNFVKYDTEASSLLKAWSWVQLFMLIGMTFHLLYAIVKIGSPNIFIYAVFLFVMVYCFTSLMDRNPNSIWMELVKSIFGLAIMYRKGNWFGLDEIINGGTIFMTIYLIASVFVVGYFVFYEIGKEKLKA